MSPDGPPHLRQSFPLDQPLLILRITVTTRNVKVGGGGGGGGDGDGDGDGDETSEDGSMGDAGRRSVGDSASPVIPQRAVNGNNPNFSASSFRPPHWPTVDGPLGLSEEDSLGYARRFFHFGFMLLPWLWALNCFYFWPVLRNSQSFPLIRPYIVRSAIGFAIFTALLFAWALTFAIGGERLFGPVWDQLVMYNVADRLGLTGWS